MDRILPPAGRGGRAAWLSPRRFDRVALPAQHGQQFREHDHGPGLRALTRRLREVLIQLGGVSRRDGYGRRGEYVAFDVHPFRTTQPEHWTAHLENSRRTFLRLVEKARSFPEKQAQALIADRNYAALDQLVLEHLMGK